MKKAPVILLFLTSSLWIDIQNCSAQYGFNTNPPAQNYDAKGNPLPQPLDGDGFLGQVYNNTACGLNYCQASVMTATRYSPPGVGLPATLNISCLPASFNVLVAYIWWTESSGNNSATATVTNPIGSTASYAANLSGSGPDKCWGAAGSRAFRANVTPSISGNGAYTINISNGSWAVDGITLFIIYTDPTVTYKGTMIINDGNITVNGGNSSQTMTGFTACGNSTYAAAFAMAGDLQDNVAPTHNTTLNGNTSSYGQNFWNYDETTATSVFAGQTTSSFGFNPPGSDCYTWAVMGLYFQTTTCGSCVPCSLSLAMSKTDVNCGQCNGSVTANISGGTIPYTYSWNTTPVQTTATATGLCIGTYTVNINDASGCDTTASISIVDLGGTLTVTPSTTPISCFGACNGTVSATTTGGTSPYTYFWSGGLGAGQNKTNVCAGTYTVSVTDANGCTGSATINLTEPNPIDLSAVPLDESCAGACDGQLFAAITGGTGPFTYTWTPGPMVGQSQLNICAGTYTVNVMDANGCVQQNNCCNTTTVGSGSSVTASFTYNGNQCLTGNSFNFTNTGTMGVSYFWTFGDATNSTLENPTHTYSSPGSYIVTQYVCNGPCCVSYSLTVNVYAEPTASIIGTNVSCFGACNGSANLTVSGGQSPYIYSWSNGFMGEDPINLCANTYSVTVTDANGCTATAGVIITQPTALTTGISGVNASCFGICNGTATATPSGGTGAYTYQWNDPLFQTTATATGLCAGTRIVAVTDANGCTVNATQVIGQPADMTLTPGSTPATCGSSDGSVSVGVSGGNPSYTYLWSPGGCVTATCINLPAGTYTVTVTDANSCTKTTTATINTTAGVTTTASVTSNYNGAMVSCFGACNGSAQAFPSGGSTPYTYSWNTSPVQTTATATGLCAGTRIVTVTDAAGCIASASVTLTQPPALNAAITASNQPLCNGACNGNATASVSGGTGTYNYSWSPSGGTGAMSSSTLCAGTVYTVTVTDANGCMGTATVTVGQPALLTVSVTGTNVSCNGGSNGAATTTVNGGTGSYNYLWSPGNQTSSNLNNIAAGTYSVTATDANGCTAMNSVTITAPIAISFTTSISNAYCGLPNGSACVTPSGGTPGYTYLWNDSLAQTTSCATGLYGGITYTVNVTDSKACPATTTVTLNNLPGGNAVITLNNNTSGFGICDGQASATLTSGTLPYTYLWNDPLSQTTATADSLCAGTWCVTITDSVGCTASSCITITQPPPVTTSIIGTNASCNGSCNGAADLTVTGGASPYVYAWTGPGGFTATTQDIAGLCAGTYYVTVTDANSVSTQDTVVITEPNPVTVSITKNNTVCYNSCDGNAASTVTGGTGSYTYAWNTTPVQTTANANVLCAGTYVLTVTDANGCMGTNTVTINEPPAIIVSVTTVSANCGQADGSASATVTNGTPIYTYLWNDPGTQTNATADSLLAGTYSVLVTDASGCTGTGTGTVSDLTGPSAVITGKLDVSCPGGNDGAATVGVFDGTPPYAYSWSAFPLQTSATATGLSAGTYTATVTDANGCVTTVSVVINEPPALIASISSSDNPNCNGSCDGTATASAVGGTGSYTYSWNTSPVQTTATVTGLCAGTRQVTVTDANSCTTSVSVTLTEPPILTAPFTKTDALCGGACNGTSTVTPTGGTPAYTYSWNTSPVQTTATATGLCAGSHIINITDNNGCTASSTVVIGEPTALNDSIFSSGNINCSGNCNGYAQAQASGGITPYSYLWSNGQTSDNVGNLCAGTYCITVTDANGCSDTACVIITEPAPLTGTISPVNVSCFGACDGSATVTAGGGTSPYTYLWNDLQFQTTPTATGLCAGSYTVNITDNNGCSIIRSIIITQPGALSFNATITPSTCGFQNGAACVTVMGGVFPYIIQWNDPEFTMGTCIDSVFAGCYNPVVTDANGCAYTIPVCINDIVGPDIDTVTTTEIFCNGGTSMATVTLVPLIGTPPFVYLWKDGVGDTISFGSSDFIFGPGGTYSITVIDANGCIESRVFTIYEPPALASAIVTSQNVSCFGACNGYATVAAGGGTPPYNYLWSPSNQTTATADSLCEGFHNVFITDDNGCSTANSVSITQPDPLAITPVVTDVRCYGGSDGQITLLPTPTGGTAPYTYNWLPPGTGGNVATVTNLSAGIYVVVVTDYKGCSVSQNITVNQPFAPLTANGTSFPSTCGNANGMATVTPSGGTPSYTYSWNTNPSQTNDTAFGLAAGPYNVLITDARGCTLTFPISVTNIAGPVINFITTTDVDCNGNFTGGATASVSGGSPPVNYFWDSSPVQSTQSATGLPAGSICLTVTDLNGCVDTECSTVAEPPLLVVSSSGDTTICYGGSAVIRANATGGTYGGGGPDPEYTFSWDNGLPDTSAHTVSPLITTTYTVTVTDVNGCQDFTTLTVTVNPPLAVTSDSVTICNGDNAIVAANATGGDGSYIYLWDDGPPNSTASSISVSPSVQTVYTVIAGDGCSIDDTASAIVFVNPLPAVAFNWACEPDPFITQFNTIVSGGTPPYTYNWDFDYDGVVFNQDATGDMVVTHSYNTSGNYNVMLIVSDNLGCSNDTIVTIQSPPTAEFYLVPGNGETSILNPLIGFLDASFYNIVLWEWDFGNGVTAGPGSDTITGVPNTAGTFEILSHTYGDTGTYYVTLTVTDINGCMDIQTDTVHILSEYILFAPSAFTPNNNDELNDYFFPKILGANEEKFEMYIYSRWGGLIAAITGVIDLNNPKIGWDGRANEGKDIAQQDVYVWVVRLEDLNGEFHQYVGHVTLIR